MIPIVQYWNQNELLEEEPKAANKIIASGMKKRSGEAKGLWTDYLHKTLYFYHFIPHSTI